MAQGPSGSIPGSRPIETTPIRVGQSRPGTPTLQPGKLYPALVVRGGEHPVLRMMGHNINGEPRYPGLQEGSRILVKPDIQGNRVLLRVVERGDIQGRVAQRFGQMMQRHPWPLPLTGAAGGQTGAAQPRAGGQAGLPGSAPLSTWGGALAGQGLLPGSGSGGLRPSAPAPGQGEGGLVRLVLAARAGESAFPRAPLLPPAPTPGAGLATASRGAAPPPPGGGRPAPPPSGPAAGGQPAVPNPPSAAQRPEPGLLAALFGGPKGGQEHISGSREAVRHWLEALMQRGGEATGGERADRGGGLWERLLTEKGRLLLDRWAYIPLPLSGERAGAWIQVPDHPQEEGAEGEDRSPPALRVWLSSERLGAMELFLPLGQGRTWRIRCERPETVRALAEQRPHLERLCRQAGQHAVIRVEGPDADVAEPPASLREAEAVEHTVSARA